MLWSIENPSLYRLVTEVHTDGLRIDEVETTFGIRSIRFDAEKGFFLNERPVKLLGTCNHHDHGGVGTAIPRRLHEWRVAQLQTMGSNAWRNAHNPAAPVLLEICDRKSMLMIPEARQNNTSRQAMDELERMVLSSRNHPCVIAWSVGNEEPHQANEIGARISAEMCRRIAELDPTRPSTQAFDFGWGDGASRVVDVVGFNYRTDQIAGFHNDHPSIPVLGSETGSTVATRGEYFNDDSRQVLRADDTEHPPWATTAEQWWTIVDKADYIAGGFVWTGFDYRGEPTPFARWPSVSSYFGIMDLCGFPKDNYWYYRAWWRPDEPLVHLLPHWNWTGREGQDIEVWVHTNCKEVELSLNGRSFGRKTVDRARHVQWSVPFEPGILEARGIHADGSVVQTCRETTGSPVALRLSSDRTRVAADGQDIAIVGLEAVDAQGRLVPDAAIPFKLTTLGAGHLIGVGNGDPTSHIPAAGPFATTFNGLAQALIRSKSEVGMIQLSVASELAFEGNLAIYSTASERDQLRQ